MQAALIAMTAGSMVMQRKAASAQAVAIENDAAREADRQRSQANEQTIARKERLLQSMSAQNAGSGASGAGLAGSTYAMMLTDMDEFRKEQGRADLGASINISNARAAAKTNASLVRRQGNINAANTAISGASAAYSMGGTGIDASAAGKG